MLNNKHKPNLAVTPAKIDWQNDQNGLEVPISAEFGDVYFSRVDGLAETQHVFLAGNQLAERLANLAPYTTFTVGELGFGTGLNVLALWQLWQHVRPNNRSRLHVISTENSPLSKADLARALASWQTLSAYSKKLLANYPPLIAGCHRLSFADDGFSIDLWLGDAAHSLSQAVGTAQVNAWFLDGFAPKCNASLWAGAVLDEIARLSGAGTTAATFSVAGVVKRGLSERGFEIAKATGFGKKREMLTAKRSSADCHIVRADCNKVAVQQRIAIVGAGVAGLSCALSFARRGHRVTLIDKTEPLAGASGNPRALLAPKLTPAHHVHEHLHSIGYLYATRFYGQLNGQAHEQPDTLVYEKTATLDLLKTSNVSPEQVCAYPPEFVTMLSAADATARAGTPLPDSMYLPDAGLVNPKALANAVLKHSNIELVRGEITALTSQHSNAALTPAALTLKNGETLTADIAIICTAHQCHLLSDKLAQPRTTRGQVSWMDSGGKHLPSMPLKYGGYCAPFTKNGKPKHIIGASFVRGTTDTAVKHEEHEHSLGKLQSALPQFNNLRTDASWQGRAGLRAQTPDYLPLVGQVDDGVYTLAATGSKGFAYAPICAEVIAGQVLGEVLPLPKSLVKKLNPLRFGGKPAA